MSKVQILEWEDSVDINIIGIFSSLPDNQLAFQLNRALGTALENAIIDFKNKSRKGEFSYSVFQTKKTENTYRLFLLKNKSIFNSSKHQANGLFENTTVQSRLIPNLNKWPYLLFSENPLLATNTHLISKIKNVSYCQEEDYLKLKSNEQSILTSILYNE